MVIRYILLVILFWLLLSAMQRYIRGRKTKDNRAEPKRPINMVACAHCGVHLPQDEAIYKNKNYYCCKEHSRPEDGEEEK